MAASNLVSEQNEARVRAEIEITGQAPIVSGEYSGMAVRVCRQGVWGGSPYTNYYSLLLLASTLARWLRCERRWKVIIVPERKRDADGLVVAVCPNRAEAVSYAVALLQRSQRDS